TAPSSVVTFTLACPLTVNVFATSSLRTCPALTSATTPTTNATTPNFRQVPIVIAITSTKPLYPSNASPPQNVPHSQPPVAPGTEFVPGSWVSSSSSLRTLCSLRPLRKPFSSFSYPFAALLFPPPSPTNSPPVPCTSADTHPSNPAGPDTNCTPSPRHVSRKPPAPVPCRSPAAPVAAAPAPSDAR